MTSLAADGWYQQRCHEVDDERRVLNERSRLIANIRLILFLAMIGLLVLAESVGTLGAPPLVGAAAFGLAFFAAVIVHAKLRERDAHLQMVRTIHEEATHRVHRRWDALSAVTTVVADDHPYARDLDILGHASVAQLIGSVRTPPGKRALFDWLLGSATPSVIRSRQAAVQELAPRLDFREQLEVAAFAARANRDEELKVFLRWTGETAWLQGRAPLLWGARITAVLSPVLLLLHLVGVSSYAWWLIPVMLNAIVTSRVRRDVHERFRRAGAYEPALRSLAAMLTLFRAERWDSDLLRRYHDVLVAGRDTTASDALRRLLRILSFAEFRRTLLHPIVQWLLLWDVHVLHALEGWRDRHGEAVRAWLDVIGPVEAICGLAGLAQDNPSWCFPDVVADGTIEVAAVGLGHPLLPEATRVPNDVHIGPPGTFLLVTGSNMSGKSTLLRAIGVNVVLAQAGGPVCCHRMRLPPVRLWTSMRIDDSLERGVSFFMAGLQRLKLIIDAARDGDPARQLLYLLDEIMQGTNSAERSVAVREIVRELIDRGAIGAMTTHDLALAEAPELVTAAHAVHFSETVDARDGGMMSFDYTVRPGVATSRNALRLMELMGLRHTQ